MIVNCDRLWSQLVTFAYRVRRKPRVVNRLSEPGGQASTTTLADELRPNVSGS